MSYGFVSSSHPPTRGDFIYCHRVAERFIRHIVGCCLLFVLIINFSPCQKANCVLFVSGGVVGELCSADYALDGNQIT